MWKGTPRKFRQLMKTDIFGGARVSLVATPVNAARLQGIAADSALEIVELPFPLAEEEAGGTDEDDFLRVFQALYRLAGPLEAYVRALPQRPSCIISDYCNPWTAGVARSVGVPRLSFCASSCFYSLCDLNVSTLSHPKDDDAYTYVVPGMPVRVEMAEDAWSSSFFTTPAAWVAFMEEAREGIRTADGAVVNTFLDLEEQFVECYEAVLGKPVWTLGPFFLHGHGGVQQQEEKAAAVTAWLDAMDDGAVTYVNFGSVVRMPPEQLCEVGHGLEDSGTPFLWVVKEAETTTAAEQSWLRALQARTAGRGLVMRGWAPQLAILAHPAVGGFVTHCGWNSMLESLAHGVPLLTWPQFADQFLNERLAVDVLGVGVPACSVFARRGDVAPAVLELMGAGEVAQERRRKAKEYGERAGIAMRKGGSSYENLTKLMQSFTTPAAMEPRES
uniref:Uncharacterized protein n=1 Tax=Avena sativa TaxID=4498 RepID=A0ACD5WR32_AVESA